MSKERKDNITVKIFALVIAIVLWSYVASEVNPEITSEIRNIDVTFTNVDALESSGVVALEPEEATINVKLSGRRSDMVKITEDDIVAKVDLKGYGEGSRKVPVDVEVNSNKVKLVDYDPKVITFEFDKIARKEETVNIKTEGKLESGYVLGDIEVKSSSVFLKGPESLINSISEVVAIADIEGRTTDINLTLPVKILDNNGNEIEGIDSSPNIVEVHIPVYKIKTVPVELQIEGRIPDDYKILNMKIYPSEIKIKGKREIIDKINFIKTVPVNANELIMKNYFSLELESPKGIELVNPNERVRVTYDVKKPEEEIDEEPEVEPGEKTKSVSFNYNIDEIEINGLAPELFIDEKESTNVIKVTVKGLESKIKRLTKKDLTPEINLTDFSEGTHSVKVNIKGLNGVEITSITPPNITIVLKEE